VPVGPPNGAEAILDLSSGQRDAIEAILGRALDDGETLSIRPVSVVRDAAPPEKRREIARRLRQYFEHLDRERPPCSQQELDEAIDEALKHIRPSYTPRQ
jgi:hypothetical protein